MNADSSKLTESVTGVDRPRPALTGGRDRRVSEPAFDTPVELAT